MTWSVYQHWDPLKVCVVGRSYPPEFYSWINVPHVRQLFERIAVETEEDFQNIIKKLKSFGVTVLRPDLPETTFDGVRYVQPPMCPRDYTVMIGDTYYDSYHHHSFEHFYHIIKKPDWPHCKTVEDLNMLPNDIKERCLVTYERYKKSKPAGNCYSSINEEIKKQGNTIEYFFETQCTGAMVARIGKDLYFGTTNYNQDTAILQEKFNSEFRHTRNHIVNTGGHSDATYCPVCPGLIISLHDVPCYANTFPDWEVVYLPGQSWNKVQPFLSLKQKNRGKWWIPGFEYDQSVTDTVETWLSHWVGYVEETVFDVNMLIVDPKNVLVFNYNKKVFDALDRYGITPHVVPFRHRYFWDGGIHCITSDLHREGTMQDYFPSRA